MSFGKKLPPACRRNFDREDVALAGSALSLTRSRSVIISDLSESGAGVDGRDLPPAGDEVLMVVGSLDCLAHVVWKSGDKCGVSFEQPIGVNAVAQMKQEAQWEHVSGWWR